jgi:hypothetical protein
MAMPKSGKMRWGGRKREERKCSVNRIGIGVIMEKHPNTYHSTPQKEFAASNFSFIFLRVIQLQMG